MTYYEVIKKALYMFYHRDEYAYFYGAKGQVLTDEVMDTLISLEPAYFSKYTTQELAAYKTFSRGKIGYDCSGFVSAVVGVANYSTGHYHDGAEKTTPLLGTEGNGLYTTFGGTGKHVGLDIGYGFFLHVPNMGHTIELGRIAEYEWEHSFHFANINYEGAKA